MEGRQARTLGSPQAGTGTDDDASFEALLDLGADPAPGRWPIWFVNVADRIGNQRYIPLDELAAAGFPTGFDITG
jgi:hypothetical protein